MDSKRDTDGEQSGRSRTRRREVETEGNKWKTVKEEEANMVRKTVKYVKNFEEGRGEEGI